MVVVWVWSSDDVSWSSWGEQEQLASVGVPKAVPLGPGEAELDCDFDWLFGQGEDGLLAMLKSHSESLGEGPAVCLAGVEHSHFFVAPLSRGKASGLWFWNAIHFAFE